MRIAMFAVYALVTLVVTLHHEPWRDEADSWLTARDLPLSGVVTWTRSAGTPFLWYVLLLPLARSGLPYIAQSLLHLLIAWAAAAVFLAYAPFRLPTKALFLFSFYPLYEYAVVARSYSLGILLTFCLLALYPRREAHPLTYAALVALLFNVNAHSIGVAASLMLLLAIDFVRGPRGARHGAALAIMAGGLALSFVQLHEAGPIVPATVVSAPDFGAFLQAVSHAFVPWLAEPSTWWGVAVLTSVVISVRNSVPAITLLVVAVGTLSWIFTYLWVGGYRHYGLVLIAAVAALWLAGHSPQPARGAALAMLVLNAALMLSLPVAARFAAADVREGFSGSQEMADYLIAHQLAGHVIAAHPPAQTEAVLAHLPRRTLWYAALGASGSYMQWDRAQRLAEVTPVTRAAERAARHFAARDWLFLSNAALARPEQFGLTLVYATRRPLMQGANAPAQTNDERYWLYRATPAKVGDDGR